MDALSLNELAELLLAALCEEMDSLDHANYFLSVDEMAARLGIEDHEQVVDACHLLEEKNYLLLAFDHLTSLSALVTPLGESFVRGGGETGIIPEYQRYRAATAGNAPRPAGTSPGLDQPVASSFRPPSLPAPPPPAAPAAAQGEPTRSGDVAGHIIASMELIIRNDPSLSEGAKNDLAIDLRTLELQMSKSSVRKPMVDAVSAELRGVPALIPLIDFLLSLKEVG